jgi:hypothetical protein
MNMHTSCIGVDAGTTGSVSPSVSRGNKEGDRYKKKRGANSPLFHS